MNGTIPAGRVFGIPVRVTPGWFLAVAGSTAMLAQKVYSDLLPLRANDQLIFVAAKQIAAPIGMTLEQLTAAVRAI